MLNFCPQCGEKIVEGAAFCVQCGLNLTGRSATADAVGDVKVAKPDSDSTASTIPTVKKTGLFNIFNFLRRQSKKETPHIEPQTPKPPSVTPVLFYGVLIFLMVGIASAIFIPMAVGYPATGKDVGGAAIWSAICVHLLLRRRNKSKTFAWISSLLTIIATTFLIGALDGFINRDRYALNRELLKNPVIMAIKENDKKSYDDFLMRLLKFSRESKDIDSTKKTAVQEYMSLYNGYLRRTSDAVIISVYRAKLRIIKDLQSADPERCYRYAQGDNSTLPSKGDSSEEIRELMNLMADVVRTGVGQPEQPVNKARAEQGIDKAITVAEKKLGSEAYVMNLIDDPKGNFSGACKGTLAFMQAILVLPPSESANVLRWLTVK